jgi:hypothetical protein
MLLFGVLDRILLGVQGSFQQLILKKYLRDHDINVNTDSSGSRGRHFLHKFTPGRQFEPNMALPSVSCESRLYTPRLYLSVTTTLDGH